ncbi:unnamed protein product [Protopolystoma xenopodis]|uniref:Uncharacterized protein n=1 Tax=Protopolystoma xenopodis TaxID=117903 RepID=A0A448XSB3_9PLAT|nr:unnamed protein product [Protopolystoma xenopodis]
MCNVIIELLPSDQFARLFLKLGFSRADLEIIESKFPGGYNMSKRIRVAMEAWSGLVLDRESSSQRPSYYTYEGSRLSKTLGNSLPISTATLNTTSNSDPQKDKLQG